MNIIEKIDKEIEALKIRKQDIQARCSHPDFSTTSWGTEGNVMVGRDPSYGKTHVCNLCSHKWDTKQ
jgi:hypothetical protein